MSHYPGQPEIRRGSEAFFSDANLNRIAVPAGYEDFAPSPTENMEAVLGSGEGSSPLLRAYAASGGSIEPLQLAEVEVDQGNRGDGSSAPTQPYRPPAPSFTPNPEPSSDRLDQLADLLIDRITRKLGGQ